MHIKRKRPRHNTMWFAWMIVYEAKRRMINDLIEVCNNMFDSTTKEGE